MRRAVIAACLIAVGLTAGCGNTSQVCSDTKKTLQGFATKAQTLPPTDTAQWRQAITDVANRLDVLARRADDAKLKKALSDTATAYRAAAVAVAKGDTAQLSAVIHDQPQRLDKACG
jgi:hypothetical protein